MKAARGPGEAPPPARYGGYLAGLAGGLLASAVLFAGALLALERTGHLPPPAFSNSLCVDEKLSFLRDHRPSRPDLLVIGSSVAWRHVDGAALAAGEGGARPLNGAFCGLHANQSVYVADWLLDREPAVRQVVMIVDPQDFAGCSRQREAVFDRADADAYVYGQASPWPSYLRYFAPLSLARNALKVKAQREAVLEMDPLVFTRFGDGPLTTEKSRGLFYGPPEPLDEACFAALGRLAGRLAAEGRSLTVVSTPLHPAWKAEMDPDGALLADFDRRLEAALGDPPTHAYWDADDEWRPEPALFVDAIHLRWRAVQDFSVALAARLERGAAVSR